MNAPYPRSAEEQTRFMQTTGVVGLVRPHRRRVVAPAAVDAGPGPVRATGSQISSAPPPRYGYNVVPVDSAVSAGLPILNSTGAVRGRNRDPAEVRGLQLPRCNSSAP